MLAELGNNGKQKRHAAKSASGTRASIGSAAPGALTGMPVARGTGLPIETDQQIGTDDGFPYQTVVIVVGVLAAGGILGFLLYRRLRKSTITNDKIRKQARMVLWTIPRQVTRSNEELEKQAHSGADLLCSPGSLAARHLVKEAIPVQQSGWKYRLIHWWRETRKKVGKIFSVVNRPDRNNSPCITGSSGLPASREYRGSWQGGYQSPAR